MAAICTNNGLQRIGVQASQATSGSGPTYNVARHIQTMSWDDSTTALAAGTTTLSSPVNLYDAVFDAAPARTGQTIAHVMTIPIGSGNFTGRRTITHDDTPANVTGTSTTVVSGVDGQLLTKNADFSLAITINHIFSSVAGGTAPISTLVVDQGLQRIGVQSSQATSGSGPTYNVARHIQTMSIDDGATAITSATTTLLGPVNMYDAVLSPAPTRTNQTVTHVMTVPTGSGNFETKRNVLHDDTAANVTGASVTVVSAIQGLSLTKTSDFSATYTQNHVYTSL